MVENIEKRDVGDLLNKIASGKIKGPNGRMIGTFSVARATRVQLSSFFVWYVAKLGTERFRSPIVRDKDWAQPDSRARVLSGDEIRALWHATEDLGMYGGVVRPASGLRNIGELRRTIAVMVSMPALDRIGVVPSATMISGWDRELLLTLNSFVGSGWYMELFDNALFQRGPIFFALVALWFSSDCRERRSRMLAGLLAVCLATVLAVPSRSW